MALDTLLVNPGDLSWDRFQALGELVVYDRTAIEDQAKVLAGAEAVLVNRSRIDAPLLDRCPSLRYIGLLSTGYNQMDLEDLRARGIALTTVPDYGGEAVAQFALGLILELVNGTGLRMQDVREGRGREKDVYWKAWTRPMRLLEGMTLGIVGLGGIGLPLAKMARGLGMEVLGYARTERPEGRQWARYRPLDALLRESDIVSLHLPLNKDTYHLMNAERLALLKDDAFLVNTARGGLIDEAALMAELDRGRFLGIGLDVASGEPVGADHPLLAYERVRITPHIAWGYREARARMLDTAYENLLAWIHGEAKNRIV